MLMLHICTIRTIVQKYVIRAKHAVKIRIRAKVFIVFV